MPISERTRRKAGLVTLPRNTEEDARRVEKIERDGASAVDVERGMGLMSAASRVTVVKSSQALSKAEQLLLRSNAIDVDDIDPLREITESARSALFEPTYSPVQLALLTHRNNTINQCIAAMKVNVDGTGWTIQRMDEEEMTDADWAKVQPLLDLFEEPYPGESFITQRINLRDDIERCGYGFLEVLRDNNGEGDVVFLRHLEAKFMYVVKKDKPTVVQKVLQRGGVERTITHVTRERRFVQIIGSKMVYYREFGGSRHVHRDTGEWLDPPKPPPGETDADLGMDTGGVEASMMRTAGQGGMASADTKAVRGNEVIMFTCERDVLTPYGVPRWIAQIPSILGSREAEEFNLSFFKHGGLPPAIIFLQGGALTNKDRTAITNYLAGKAKYKQRAVIVEVVSTSGDTERSQQAKVSVERFGGSATDSMFEKYDERCALRVRMSFRLPELFVGRTESMNYSTANASYQVCEAQVFEPERRRFDEIINSTVVRGLLPDYHFRSLPLSITDATVQLQALGLVAGASAVNTETLVAAINEVAGLALTPQTPEEAAETAAMMQAAMMEAMGGSEGEENEGGEEGDGPKPPPKLNGGGKSDGKKPGGKLLGKSAATSRVPRVTLHTNGRGKIRKMDDGFLRTLAEDWSAFLTGGKKFEPESIRAMTSLVKSLDKRTRTLFNGYVGLRMVPRPLHEEQETPDVLAAAAELLGEGKV